MQDFTTINPSNINPRFWFVRIVTVKPTVSLSKSFLKVAYLISNYYANKFMGSAVKEYLNKNAFVYMKISQWTLRINISEQTFWSCHHLQWQREEWLSNSYKDTSICCLTSMLMIFYPAFERTTHQAGVAYEINDSETKWRASTPYHTKDTICHKNQMT